MKPITSDSLAEQAPPANGLYETLLARMPGKARATFTDNQLVALQESAQRCQWGAHPLDVRLSIPTPFGSCFILLVGGRERRAGDRQRLERKRHPLWTWSNALFLVPLTIAVLAGGIAVGMLLVELIRGLF